MMIDVRKLNDELPEHRRERRFAQSTRVLTIDYEGRTYPLVLCNISRRGLAGRCTVKLETGASVVVNFEDGTKVAGRVQWTRDALNGFSLVEALPHNLIAQSVRVERARPRRIAVSRPAVLHFRNAVRRAIIRNVSIGGMLVETVGRLRPGQMVHIEAGEYRGVGEIRWSEGSRAGIQLVDPLCLEHFEQASVMRAPGRWASEPTPPRIHT
jgi:hypothetical protein